jgi:hypothetical protein
VSRQVRQDHKLVLTGEVWRARNLVQTRHDVMDASDWTIIPVKYAQIIPSLEEIMKRMAWLSVLFKRQ